MSLRVGQVVHVLDAFGRENEQHKFLVVISVSPDQFLAVNTLDRDFFDCIPFEKKGRTFPRYDCFIGCKNIILTSRSQITEVSGKLDDDELRALREKILSSLYLTPVNQKKIAEAIEAEIQLRQPTP